MLPYYLILAFVIGSSRLYGQHWERLHQQEGVIFSTVAWQPFDKVSAVHAHNWPQSLTWEGELSAHVKDEKKGVLPRRWDWREHNAVTPIKQQKCGTCWAFATVAVFESLIKITTGREVDISEQQLLSCEPRFGSCYGGTFAFESFRNRGAFYEEDFSFQSTFGYTPPCQDNSVEHERVGFYESLGKNYAEPTVEELKAAIYQTGPVAAYVSRAGSWDSYKGGIYSHCTSGPLNHMVALIGYDDEEQYWIVKNSVGVHWGEDGFMRISYTDEQGQKCNGIGARAMTAGLE